MGVCKYCQGKGCIQECIRQRQIKLNTMKILKLQLAFGKELVEDMTKVRRLAIGDGHYSRECVIDIVKDTEGNEYLSIDTSNGEYGPVGIPLKTIAKEIDEHVNKTE